MKSTLTSIGTDESVSPLMESTPNSSGTTELTLAAISRR